MTSTLHTPKLAYLVSAYPAISHTFILREVAQLCALGHRIVTASINRPDRALAQMEPHERAEAERTYVVKPHGVAGALAALLFWALHAPLALLAMLRFGLRLRSGGKDEFDEVGGQHLALKMREADAVVCISQFARGQLMRITDPAHWSKFRVCRLGVEPDQFRFALRSPGPLTQLLCVGRLTPAKGQILLIRAVARLRAAGVRCHLTLVGAGPDRGRIQSEIAALGLGDDVTLTGALTQDQVRERLVRADIFVLPSLAEGIPVVLMEAMSCGVPCVTTPVNGIPELVLHEETGLLATPGDVASLAARDKVRRDFDLHRNVVALGGIFSAFPQAA